MNYALYCTASLALAAICPGASDFAADVAAVAPTASMLAEYRLAQTSKAVQMRREIEWRRRKMKEKMERQRREMERRQKEAQRKAERFRKDVARRQQEVKKSLYFPSRGPEPPPFDPSTAPDPKVCFETFIKKIQNADSLDDFISYLPLDDQRYLKREQAEYDPNEVPAKRARWRRIKPDITEETLIFHTQSPYARAFKRYKRIAKKFRHTKSVKIDGNQAILNIATSNTALINGVPYRYSSATVTLDGQAGYWRMTGYKDSSVYYRYPQD